MATTTTSHDGGTQSRVVASRVGREHQRFDGAIRLLACVAVVRRDQGDEEQVLVISSSKRPTEWILPKGGWEDDEDVEACALREVEEEAGVSTLGALHSIDASCDSNCAT